MLLSKRQRFGLRGEKMAAERLECMGYTVKTFPDFCETFDLLITDLALPVEVKIARRTMRYIRPGYYRPRWLFNLANVAKQDHILIMICQEFDRNWFFIAPSWLAQSRRSATISSHPTVYGGLWAKYLEDWRQIERVAAVRLRLGQSLQLSLFGQAASRREAMSQ